MDLTPLRDIVSGTDLEGLAPFLSAEYLDSLRHGDFQRWRLLAAALPDHTASSVDLESQVRIGLASDIDMGEQESLEQKLREFIPWRKGPFEIFGIKIDAEWRSDLKWARLQDHIGSLKGRRVLDVGSGNGYSTLRMLGAGADLAIGMDPHLPYVGQFAAIKHFIPDSRAFVLPMTLDQWPEESTHFDTVFSMGVLYHRRSPLDHLLQLHNCLRPGGQLVLESIVVDGPEGYALLPKARYARMGNAWFFPSIPTLLSWLPRCGFTDCRVIDESVTTNEEQRRTQWMPFDSLADSLDPDNNDQTVEGYPAPRRVIILADRK